MSKIDKYNYTNIKESIKLSKLFKVLKQKKNINIEILICEVLVDMTKIIINKSFSKQNILI